MVRAGAGRPLKRSEYDRMVELGLFQDERVELIRGGTGQNVTTARAARVDGSVAERSPERTVTEAVHPAHPVSTRALGRHRGRHRTRARCRGGAPLEIRHRAPPDSAADHRGLGYDASETSRQGGGVRERQHRRVLDRQPRRAAVEVYLPPDGDRYAEVRTLRAGDVLRPAALPDVAIAIAEILPAA